MLAKVVGEQGFSCECVCVSVCVCVCTSKSRRSAGTLSPTDRHTVSPGTSSLASMCSRFPSLILRGGGERERERDRDRDRERERERQRQRGGGESFQTKRVQQCLHKSLI